jgi:acetolactate synthase I/II/III large subunit
VLQRLQSFRAEQMSGLFGLDGGGAVAMNGAESLVHSLLKSGVTTCFSNPGTSEMHFVAALDRIPGLHCVLGLFEGVVTGAADGYARMAGMPAATLLHCGPGLANGLANLHNARRAATPVVNIVGDQATYHRPLDPPLTADTEGWARGVSGWVRTATDVRTVGSDAATAVQASMMAPGQVATLILPSDTSWNEGGVVAEALPRLAASTVSPGQIEAAVNALRRGGAGVVLLLGGTALHEKGLALAHRISAATGCRVMAQGSNARMARGQGRLPVERVPYVVDVAVKAMAGTKQLILVGSRRPVTFFAYPNMVQSSVPDDAEVHVLARPEQDISDALARLADALDCPTIAAPNNGTRPDPGKGALTPEAVAATLGALMPDDAVIADESVTFGCGFFAATRAAPPHDWLNVTGGAIGGGMPMATGAAIGAPGRRVINLQADGSAMYTMQALWTQAREKLDVTTVLLSNRKYAILLGELANVGANPGRTALDMMDIGNPDIEWTRLSASMGVEAERTDTAEGFTDLLAYSLKRSGPFLIELLI